jgi:hypothetical protein
MGWVPGCGSGVPDEALAASTVETMFLPPPPPRSLFGVMDALAARQLRWSYAWMFAQFAAGAGGALWVVLFAARALTALVTGSAQHAGRLALLAVLGGVVAGLVAAGSGRVALVPVVRRRARQLLEQFPLNPAAVDQLAFAAAGRVDRSGCDLDLVPVEALVIARDAAVAAAADRLGLDETRLTALVLLCRRWPGHSELLVPAAQSLEDERLRALVALAPSWSLEPEELIALTRAL